MLRKYKEVIAIILSLSLLAILLIKWASDIYNKAADELFEEVDMIFVESILETRDSVYMPKIRKLETLTFDQPKFPGENLKEFLTNKSTEDSLTITSLKINTDKKRDGNRAIVLENISHADDFFEIEEDTTNEKYSRLHELMFSNIDAGDRDISFTISLDSADVIMRFDTVVIIAESGSEAVLNGIFQNKMKDAGLGSLKNSIHRSAKRDVAIDTNKFVTEAQVLRESIQSNYYRAMIDDVESIALRRIVPQLLLGLCVFALFCIAFWMLYKSIMQQKQLVKIQNELVSNISHELKTPISVVNVALEAIQHFDADKDSEKTKRYIDISKKEVNRLATLVDKVINLSVDPHQEIPKTAININTIAQNVIDSMSIQLIDQSRAIELVPSPNDPMIMAAPAQVKSVFYNLIDNAIKYSEEGKIIVAINETHQHWIISVSDQGIGIDKPNQAKVFDKLYRVPTEDVHDVKGTGLGLYHVKEIVQYYGGTISLNSRLGEGTVVTINWPKE